MPARTRSMIRLRSSSANGADDDDHCPTEWSAGVDVLPEADELDIEMVQLVEDLEEVARRTGDAIERPDQNGIETMLVGIVQQVVEPRPLRFSPADPVGVLANDLITTLRSHRSQIVQLSLGMLIDGRDPHVQGTALHQRWPFFFGAILTGHEFPKVASSF